MAKQTNTKKKAATTVGGGGRGTKVSRLNLKLVIPMVLVVAALGGFYIFQKSSAANLTGRNLSGGKAYQKGRGDWYMLNDSGNIYTTVDGSTIRGKRACAYGGALKDAYVNFRAVAVTGRVMANDATYVPKGRTFNLCVTIPENIAGKVTLDVSGTYNAITVGNIMY